MERIITTIFILLCFIDLVAQERPPLKADRTLEEVNRREREEKIDRLKARLSSTKSDSSKVDILIEIGQLLSFEIENQKLADTYFTEAIELSKSIGYDEGLLRATKSSFMTTVTDQFFENESLEDELEQINIVAEQAILIRNFSIATGCFLFLIVLGLGFQYVYIKKTNRKISDEKKRSEELLLNILPFETAKELKLNGHVMPKKYNLTTILFTDFKEFTKRTEIISPDILIKSLHYYFEAFDKIISEHDLEKIKTIGDSYMCVGGVPIPNDKNPNDVVQAALDIIKFVKEPMPDGLERFEIRIGIHSGPIIAGIVGIKKFQYDVWGNAVNIASRMESKSEPQKINISKDTYLHVKNHFNCTYRGKVEVKHGKKVDMYYVESD